MISLVEQKLRMSKIVQNSPASGSSGSSQLDQKRFGGCLLPTRFGSGLSGECCFD
jgi:hypothetical protein